jgi:uncharacterized protein
MVNSTNIGQIQLIGSDTSMPITGKFVAISGIPLLLQDIQQLILTNIGERVNRPTFGCMINGRVWENIDQTANQGITDIQAAINTFEPRVTLLGVTSTIFRDDGIVLFSISFIVNATNEPLNLVLPFRSVSDLLSQ